MQDRGDDALTGCVVGERKVHVGTTFSEWVLYNVFHCYNNCSQWKEIIGRSCTSATLLSERQCGHLKYVEFI